MTEDPRYEEQSDLPLPDRDAAWQKMAALLDEEERRRPLLPIWFWRYAVPALLLVGAAVGGWRWLSGEKEGEGLAAKGEASPTGQTIQGKTASEEKEENVAKPSIQTTDEKTSADKEAVKAKTTSGDEKPPVMNSTPLGSSLPNASKPSYNKPVTATAAPPPFDRLRVTPTAQKSANKLKARPAKAGVTATARKPADDKFKVKPAAQRPADKLRVTSSAQRLGGEVKRRTQDATVPNTDFVQTKKRKAIRDETAVGKSTASDSNGIGLPVGNVPLQTDGKQPLVKQQTPSVDVKSNASDSTQQKAVAKPDSTHRNDTAALPVPLVVKEGKTKKAKAASQIIWSAGVGMQQSIALQSQPSATPDSMGRKRAFFDYFPSVYLKAERGRWAVQAEFQYGVPQPTAALSFSQKTTVYAASYVATETERLYLRRLYYHQLPVSLNYRLFPQLSVGIGGVYNIFQGAVVEREVSGKDVLGGDVDVRRQPEDIKGYRDSFFYKTTAGLLLQTDYHWKRLSLGLRYTQNLQPFIKYTQPNGAVADKANNALQAILRFRLWASK